MMADIIMVTQPWHIVIILIGSDLHNSLFQQSAAEQYRASTSRDADLLQIHKQRRPQMLDYPHGQHAQTGMDRSRYRYSFSVRARGGGGGEGGGGGGGRGSTSRDADLLQIHKQRRPQMLDYPHGQHAQTGMDRSRYRFSSRGGGDRGSGPP